MEIRRSQGICSLTGNVTVRKERYIYIYIYVIAGKDVREANSHNLSGHDLEIKETPLLIYSNHQILYLMVRINY